jgi:predicted nucleic acid-binding protein
MATTAVDPLFVDTNVLVNANIATAPLHRAALQELRSLQKAGVPLWISRQVIREYLATLSRPQTFASPQPPQALVSHVGYFLTHFLIAVDGPLVTSNLLSLITSIPIGGKQIHDANIVATMQAQGIRRLMTSNVADFTRFGALIQVIPLVPAP